MKTSISLLAFLASAGLALAAEPPQTWTENCASCHGGNGKGATRAGRQAGVKDLTDVEYQKKFSDEETFARIKNGAKDESGKEEMKAFGDKLTDEQINELIAFVRSLAPQAP